jgi:hypothetical protein
MSDCATCGYSHLGPCLDTAQPAPKRTDAPHTVDLVLLDLGRRKAMGIAKYGMPHQHDNGRDHLVDAYQEALDLCVYLRAELERRTE